MKTVQVQPVKSELTGEPSAAAWKVVHTLWPDMSERETIRTDWGDKTPQGLAASIDAITGIPALLAQRDELLAALKLIADHLAKAEKFAAVEYSDELLVPYSDIEKYARAAIEQAKGGAA